MKKQKGTNIVGGLIPRILKPALKLGEELRFPQLQDASPNPVLITNAKNKIYYVNPAWEKLTGYSFEEVRGKDPKFLQSGKTPKRILRKIWKRLGSGKSFSTEKIIEKKKNGEHYQIHATFFPIRKNKKNIFYVQVLHDITRRIRLQKALEENEKKFRLILDAIDDYAIYILNRRGNIKSWNRGAETLKGYTDKEVIGKHFSMFYSQPDIVSKKPMSHLKKAQENGKYEEEGWRVRKDGTTFWADVVIHTMKDSRGRVKGFVEIVRDFTQHKELDRQKDAFIGIASHELKTPVTTIKGYAQLLERRLQQTGDTRSMYFFANLNTQVDRLAYLLNDLLNVSIIEAGKLELHKKWFDMTAFVKKMVIDFQYILETHQIVLEGESRKKVYADENRIEQVLSNLITNAVKYSPHVNKVIVHLKSDKKNTIVGVEDFGLGIAKKDQKYIFQRFYRTLDKEESKTSGFGLGLYIASEIIKRHQGKIWVESEKGKGSTFFFSLPG